MNYRQNGLGSYKDQLHPWCIIRQLPDMRSRLIIRFRRRNDAEAHLQILKANNPNASYEIIFDLMSEYSDLTSKEEQLQSHLDRD